MKLMIGLGRKRRTVYTGLSLIARLNLAGRVGFSARWLEVFGLASALIGEKEVRGLHVKPEHQGEPERLLLSEMDTLMRKQRNIVRFIVLMLTPVVLCSANILPIHSSQSAQAATDASRTKPNDQPVLRAVANGKIAFGRDGEIFTMNSDGSDVK